MTGVLGPSKDPLFVDDLSRKIRGNQAPVPPPPKQLIRKVPPTFFRRGFRRSLFFHLAFVAWTLLQGLVGYFWESDAEKTARLKAQVSRSAIRVDMVDLPSLKLQDLEKIDATADVGAPKAPEKEIEVKKPQPSPTAMVDKTTDAKKKTDAKSKTPTAADRLKALRDSLRVDNRRAELSRRLKGEGEGTRPALGGNIVSEGDSTTGDLATQVDAFGAKVKAHLRRHWDVPGWMTTGRLRAEVLVKISPDGRVLSRDFTKRSGNAEFDGAVARAIEQSDPFPPPPEALKRVYMEEGILWGFPQ